MNRVWVCWYSALSAIIVLRACMRITVECCCFSVRVRVCDCMVKCGYLVNTAVVLHVRVCPHRRVWLRLFVFLCV
jgi:hypothetical protein